MSRIPLLALAALPALARPALAGIEATAGARVVEVRDGVTPLATFVPRTPPESRRAPVAREVTVAARRVLEVRLPLAGRAQEEVWLAERTASGTTTLWQGVVGALDSDGETALALALDAGAATLFQTASRLVGCDGTPLRLFRQIFDFTSRRFKPAPPEAAAPAAAVVRARRGGPPADARPAGGFYWTGASTAAGVRDARGLVAPYALGDGDPATIWRAGTDGPGASLVARTSVRGVAVTGLRLLPGDPGGEQALRAGARLRRLRVVLGSGEDRRFDVELVEDDDGGARRRRDPFWIPLPRPVVSSCVELVLTDVTGGPAAVADLEVVTDLDGAEGLARLVDETARGTECESRVPLLVAQGAPAAQAVARAIPGAAGGGRECLVDALARLVGAVTPPPEAGPALAAALVGASAGEERLVLGALPRLPSPPVELLAALVADERRADADRVRGARALAALDGGAGAPTLIAVAGTGPAAVRAAVRELLATSAGASAAAVREAAQAATAPGRRGDLLFALGSLAGREPRERPAAVALLAAAAERGDSFEVRARATAALGRVAHEEAWAALARLRATGDDAVLRSIAAGELLAAPPSVALPALREALGDGDPRVRELAARGLGRHGESNATALLIAAAKQEPWPFVRRAQVAALGSLCGPGATDLMVRANERDLLEVRQQALAGLVRCRDARARGVLLAVLGRRLEDPDLRAQAARLLGELGDRGAAPAMAEALDRLRVESQADLALEGVAITAVRALAQLGGPRASSAALALLADERPVLKRAALEALAQLCDPGATEAVRSARRSADEGVSAAAAATERRCERRR